MNIPTSSNIDKQEHMIIGALFNNLTVADEVWLRASNFLIFRSWNRLAKY